MDKVTKIYREIERLRLKVMGVKTDFAAGQKAVLTELLGFIEQQNELPTSVWHNANTLPSDPKAVIVEHNEYSTSICRAEQMSRVKGAKWAYVEDLLKL